MIPMSIELSQCQQNALHDSNVSRKTQLRHTSFIGRKRQAENKLYTIKYKAPKELEKGTPHKDVASLFGVKKCFIDIEKDKIFEKYNSGLISEIVKPEKYEELDKADHKWFLILRSENVQISGPMLKEKALEFAGGWNIEGFQASEGQLEKWTKKQSLHFLKFLSKF